LQVAARVVLVAGRGSLAEQLARLWETEFAPPARERHVAAKREASGVSHTPPSVLEFWNGVGGFSSDGAEYVTVLDDGATTPAPWINVIANPAFGFHVSAEGGGYVWSQNSRENQLTRWSMAVRDPPGTRSTFATRTAR
jgi:cyclic beta-1,2-glucan synthetase